MSLLSSLSTGTTGLTASSSELSVVGDNIANSNTVGFKTGRADFEDALSQNVVAGTGQVGLGARLMAVQKLLTQGALTDTGVATDLALQGNGFFVVHGTHNGQAGNYYTRAGQFTTDSKGYLVNQEGLRVQGFTADAIGVVGGAVGDLLVGNASALPRATGNVSLKGNVKSDSPIPAVWDPLQPSQTSNFQTSTAVYDTLGAEHQVQIFFRNSGSGAWEWHAMTDGAGISGGTAGVQTEIASGSLAFDDQGALVSETQTSAFNPINAVQPQALVFNLGDPTSSGGTGLSGVTQFASASATNFVGQDGYASGQLSSIQIDAKGNVNGIFTNGQSRVLAQVAVAGFPAADQLQRAGTNLLAGTPAAGEPVIGAAGEGGRASITSGAVEQSNVDMSDQLVRMIAAQRAFEANSKTITTADQLLSELISMKR